MTWKINHNSRREARVTAVHEVGRAVIAAHLGVPFEDASALLRRVILLRVPQHMRTPSFLRRHEIVRLASRAAVDEILPRRGSEIHYKKDESDVIKIAEYMGIPEVAFPTWREVLLGEARRLVALGDIRATIIAVAHELNNPFTGNMTAKEVEAKLKSACVAFARSRSTCERGVRDDDPGGGEQCRHTVKR